MPLVVGDVDITRVKYGTTEISKVIVRGEQVWPEAGREPPVGDFYDTEPSSRYWWEVLSFSGFVSLTIYWNGTKIVDEFGAIPSVDTTEWTDTTSGLTYHRGTYHEELDVYGVYRTA